jgi:hypothetical protein
MEQLADICHQYIVMIGPDRYDAFHVIPRRARLKRLMSGLAFMALPPVIREIRAASKAARTGRLESRLG